MVCDIYSRYQVRIKEMRESNKILKQALEGIKEGPVMTNDPRVAIPSHEEVYEKMEALIRRFYIISKGFPAPKGETYGCVEAPKGELGFYIVSDGDSKPYRLKIRAPSLLTLELLK